MLAIIPLLATISLSWRYPGAALAGLFFGFPATLLSGNENVTPLYTVATALLLLLKHGKNIAQIRMTAIDAMMVFVVAVVTMSTLWTPAPSPAKVWVDLTQPTLAVYIIAKLAVNFGDSTSRLQEFITTFALLGIIYVIQIISVADVSGSRLMLEDGENVAVGLTQALVISSICGLALLLSGGALAVRIVGLSAIVLAFYAIMLTGTRGAFVAVVAGYAAMIYMKYNIKRLAVSAAVLIPTLFIIANILPGHYLLFAREFRIFRFQSYGAEGDQSSQDRIWRFDTAKEFISEAPFFGKGLGSYDALTNFGYPHNFFLDVGVQMGFLGLFAVSALGIVTIIFVRKLHLPRLSNATIALCAIIFAGFIHQQVSFSLPHAKTLFLIGAVSGFNPVGGIKRVVSQNLG